MKIGFIGLGNMGSGIAANLLKSGHQLSVYNRTTSKADPLVKQGATCAAHVADACRGEVVMTMLADDQALESVTFGDGGIVSALAEGAIHVFSGVVEKDCVVGPSCGYREVLKTP
jgi:3-hydroxyisobutyrate dehydrogenase-like beta-hydroxyacid dehydrogenase